MGRRRRFVRSLVLSADIVDVHPTRFCNSHPSLSIAPSSRASEMNGGWIARPCCSSRCSFLNGLEHDAELAHSSMHWPVATRRWRGRLERAGEALALAATWAHGPLSTSCSCAIV